MCQQYFLRHWLCDHDIDMVEVPCQGKTILADLCIVSQEQVLIDGNCARCTPNVNPGAMSWGERFPRIDELMDSDAIIAGWDRAVAMFSPDDQKLLFGLVTPDTHNTTPQAPRKTLPPKSRKKVSPASLQAPLLGQYQDLPHPLPSVENTMPNHHGTQPQYWCQNVFSDPAALRQDNPKSTNRSPTKQTMVPTSNFQPSPKPKDLLGDRSWRLPGKPDDNVPFPSTAMPNSLP